MKFGLNDTVIADIIRICASYPQVQEVILYGSRAKGNFKTGSDIDLVIKGEQLNLSLLNSISSQFDDLYLPYTFDLSIFSQLDNAELINHINRVGISLYKR
jgi:predicted nucleotidyltransferase